MCREGHITEHMTDKRSRSVVVTCKPSRLAHDFIKTTCGSLSGYESGYTSDTSVATAVSCSTLSSTDQQDITILDEEAGDCVFSSSPPQRPKLSRPPREMTVYPSLPRRYRKGHDAHARLKKASSVNNVSAIGSNEGDSPTHSSSIAEAALLSTSLPSLIVPGQFRLKSPSVVLTRPNKPTEKRKVQSLGSRMRYLGHQKLFSVPSFDESNFLSSPTITSPVRIKPEPSHSNSMEERKLIRSYAIKRRSLLDLGISQMASDVSARSTILWNGSYFHTK